MPQYNCDTLIKTLRLERGFSQKQLAEGICTKDTISRIERGERLPDWHTFERLMNKLGENPHTYYKAIITGNERQANEIKEEIQHLITIKEYAQALELINKAEAEHYFQDAQNTQFLFQAKAACHIVLSDAEVAYEYIMKAIKSTRPNFDENKIDTYILTNSEVTSINTLAIISDKLSGIEKATEIFLKLKASLDKNFFDEADKTRYYAMLLSNISRNLKYLKRYEECVEVCDQGIAYSKKMTETYYYPKFVINKSHALLLMGEKEKGVKYLQQACCLYKGLERFEELESVIETFRDELGVEISVSDFEVIYNDCEPAK